MDGTSSLYGIWSVLVPVKEKTADEQAYSKQSDVSLCHFFFFSFFLIVFSSPHRVSEGDLFDADFGFYKTDVILNFIDAVIVSTDENILDAGNFCT
mgnify:CR=1 FL=1